MDLFVVPTNWYLGVCKFASPFPENVALRKPALQSGNSYSHSGAAHLAVDGRPLAVFSDRSCSMSCGTSNLEYWTVDLQGRHRVYVVTILAREDRGGMYFQNRRVLLLVVLKRMKDVLIFLETEN